MLLYKLVNSVQLAAAAREGKDFCVFASKKLKNVLSWPDWVLENGGPEKAARLKAEQEGASGTAGEEEQNEESDVDDEGR